MKAYGGVNVYFHVFLTSAQGKFSVLDPSRLTLDKKLAGIL